ncbi:MAG: HAD-IA family hydrolase [Halothece sp.]
MDTHLVIFDFDGTIADTKESVISITNRLAPEFGFAPLDEKEIAHFQNLTAKEVIKQSRVCWWQLPFLMKRVRQELKTELKNISPIKGIDTVLETLTQNNNCQLGIITSNSEDNASQFLRQHGLLHCFNFIESSFHVFGKDKVIKRCLHQKNVSPEMVTYVGDETRDIEAAKKSGVRSVAVSWGFNTAEALAKCNPDFLIDQPSELLLAMKPACEKVSEQS